MANSEPIPVFDRKTGILESEWIKGQRETYETGPRISALHYLQSFPLYEKLHALYEKSILTKRLIKPFIRDNNIDMTEYENQDFASFADFFVRRFKESARPFEPTSTKLAAFCEARYFAWSQCPDDQEFPIKGFSVSALGVMENKEIAREFAGGPVILARLNPVDYHHFHFPDHGRSLNNYQIGHRLFNVNPSIVRTRPTTLFRNKRHVSVLETENFGKLAMVEIGAMNIGQILQTHPQNIPFRKGDEKGMFQFGGSAIMLFGQAGRWLPSPDLVRNTLAGHETRVFLGTEIGVQIQSQT